MTDQQIKERYAPRAMKPEFGYVYDDGQKIYYAIQGDAGKPLLVLVHGAPGRWYSSINLMDDPALLDCYRILAYDRPGYGKSNGGRAINSIQKQAQYLATLIGHFNPRHEPVAVVGRSYGTAIASCYAMSYPERVKKLVLIGSCIDPQKEKFFWFSYPNISGTVQSFMPPALNIATSEKFSHKNELEKLLPGWEHIQSPTYVLHGTKDWISDTANAWFAYNRIINAPVSVYLLEGTGHNITVANPRLIVDLVLREEEILPAKAHSSKK